MRHPIDPRVDCVFKALLGSEDNRPLLIHFLNAVLVDDLPAPITEVETLNPYNEREAFSDKFASAQVEIERERWLKFFKEAERFNEATLPDWMHTAEMRQAMSTLNAFSEKERAYHAYQARQEFLRQQRGIQRELDKARAAKEAERRAKEAALQAKEAALAEVERLKALLKQKDV
ncbi:PD-(D/E)XK nuclease family transposase [Thiocapsa bogorovii]|uniref:PD-(D/E)XK nuclease family transposase n=1 Tax=Thiocapsa bogorovii TaxID=521689 RepID=UPI001E446D98|nr:PD-(D/E)XK nuclease family transposase [Thiocapsa bogorovii]UHD15555.1 PD-(D/E)XK nuclease family transposase [Thiocapsa bogorovii]